MKQKKPDQETAFAGKLALGTVQFGLDYGISNQSGQVEAEEVGKILKLATESGIDLLDTAAAYGNSEEVLGEQLRSQHLNFRLVTKMPNLQPNQVKNAFGQSLIRLGSSSVYGYLVHDFEWFKKRPAIWESLFSLKENRQVQKIGFSLYFPEQLTWLLEQNFVPDLVQVPYNVFDQRFAELLPELEAKGIEVHARSIYLQGLFFLDPENLNPHFDQVKQKLAELHTLFAENKIPLAEGLLCFAWLCKGIAKLVIGVANVQQLKANLMAGKWLEKTRQIYPDLLRFAEEDLNVLLPMNWK